jgi:Fe2+ or Zn2+ uptake regulation protein
MKTSNEKIFERITRAIQKQGGRLTVPRKKIITHLGTAKKPQTISEIAGECGLDEVSVYRNIAYLKSIGFLEEIQTPEGARRFALTEDHHDHIVCTDCGFIAHVACDERKQHAHPSHRDFAHITTHTLTYYGTCAHCAV